MQLRSARLCLDCEELHEEPQCPVCTSEAFVYITRWIPVDTRRTRKRAVPRPAPAPRVSHFVKGGAVGLAVLAAARWLTHTPPGTAGSPENAPAENAPAENAPAENAPADKALPEHAADGAPAKSSAGGATAATIPPPATGISTTLDEPSDDTLD
jgi:hypothetical protein